MIDQLMIEDYRNKLLLKSTTKEKSDIVVTYNDALRDRLAEDEEMSDVYTQQQRTHRIRSEYEVRHKLDPDNIFNSCLRNKHRLLRTDNAKRFLVDYELEKRQKAILSDPVRYRAYAKRHIREAANRKQ